MANHKSAKKRARQNIKIRVRNRFNKKTARTAIKTLREMEEKDAAVKFFPIVSGLIDKLAKRNTWHPNKAANLKSKLAKHVNSLG